MDVCSLPDKKETAMGSICTLRIYPQRLHAPPIQHVYLFLFWGGYRTIFIAFYLLAIIISDFPTYLKHQQHGYYRALGASGGTSATVFASIIIMPLRDICLFGILCLPGFLLGGLFLIYSYNKGKQGEDGINHDAHLFGAIFGIAFIILLSPSSASNFLQEILSYRFF